MRGASASARRAIAVLLRAFMEAARVLVARVYADAGPALQVSLLPGELTTSNLAIDEGGKARRHLTRPAHAPIGSV